METKYYEIGYDITGRKILFDENNNFITYIPEEMSEEEAIAEITNGTFILLQSLMQHPKVEIAPKEEWPLYYSWRVLNKYKKSVLSFEEFKEYFKQANLSPEQEWEIIGFWKNNALLGATKPLEKFREEYIKNILNQRER